MNEVMPHILTDKEGIGYDIVNMTRTQAASLNDRLKTEKSIYSWMLYTLDHYALLSGASPAASKHHPIDDIEWTKAVHPGVGERLMGSAKSPASDASPAPGATSRENATSEAPMKLDLSEGEIGGLKRAGRIFDDLTAELEFGLNFRLVVAKLTDEALEILELVAQRLKLTREYKKKNP